MPTEHNRATATDAADAEEQLRAAARRLATALAAAQHHPLVAVNEHCQVTATVLIDSPPVELAGITFWPTQDGTSTCEAELLRHGIAAGVEGHGDIFSRVTITLTGGAEDTDRLAALIIEHLTEPLGAAHRLRTALTAIGITAQHLRAVPHTSLGSGEVIDIGHLHADDAYRLAVLLHGRLQPDTRDKPLDLEDWSDVYRLADLMAPILATAAGTCVTTDARPACETCTRPSEITIGYLTTVQAHRLATTIRATADASGPVADHEVTTP
jgi:hypothetical protein